MKSIKVLIVDDNRDLGEGLKAVLEDEGYQVTLTMTGEEAIALSREQKFGITFMDMKLPDMTGIDALIEIKNFNVNTSVVMMSGYRVHELLDEALERGAKSVLNKPFTIDQMLAEIERD